MGGVGGKRGGGRRRGGNTGKEEKEEEKNQGRQSLVHRVVSTSTLDQQGNSTSVVPVTGVGRDPEVSSSQHPPNILYLKMHCR